MTIKDLYDQLLPYAGQPLTIPGTVFPGADNIARFCASLLSGNPLTVDVDPSGVVLSGDQQTVTVTGKTPSYGFGTFGIRLVFSMAMGEYSADIAIDFDTQPLTLPGIDWFSLSNPGLAFTVGNASVPVTGVIGGDVMVNGETARLGMKLPIAAGFWAFEVTFDPLLSIDEVFEFIGSIDIASKLEPPFSSIAKDIGVKEIDFICGVSPARRVSTQLLIGTPTGWEGWTLAPGVKITAADLTLFIAEDNSVGYGIYSTLRVDSVDLALSALYPGPGQGWTLQGQTGVGEKILLTGLFSSICSLWQVSLPASFPVIYFTNLYFSFATQAGDFSFGGELDVQSTGPFSIAGQDFELAFTIRVDYTSGSPKGTYQGQLTGVLSVGTSQFGLEYDFSSSDSKLIGYWEETGGQTLELADIARTFGNADLVALLDDIPQDMKLGLESASFTYDFTNNELVLTAVSKNYGALVFVATKPASEWVFVFLVALKTIDLAALPLVGQEVGALGRFEIDDFNLLLCSGKLDAGAVGKINALIQAAATATHAVLPALPDTGAGLQKGVNLSLTFYMAGYSAPVAVGTATPKSGGSQTLLVLDAQAQGGSALLLAAPGGGTASNLQTQNGFWINLQKAFGPVYVDKIGFAYADGVFEVLFNFSLKLGELEITLDGLMIGSGLDPIDPVFGLQGLSITFSAGAVEISAGFIKQVVEGVPEYNGEALIKIGTFMLAALGSYAKVDGQTSMFIFAMITQPPLGGPAFFFVTGVAAGFGYNRGLTIPNIDQVATFPLVSPFVPGQGDPFGGGDPGAALQVLVSQNIVPVQIGEDWLAAGVQFTSFEMLQSFALVIVEFGASFEIALLGVMTASIPTGDPRPLLYAELALEVRILPDEGLVAVDAKLASNSYLLDPSCQLTGGFAFYIWFGRNTNAGDFVVTLGGYHPHFNKPAHYPDVPRLGFNWVVTSELTIKGGMYFALTPICLMAGGSLQALWQSGDLKAWFDVGADFLIAWKPYHYEIDVYLSFGVSYTFKVDLLFVTITKTISVSLGADLSIWGPAFSGVAHIHLYIVSFTIDFGAASSQTPPPIAWSEFEQSFLPPAGQPKQQQARLARRLGAAPADVPPTDFQVWTVSAIDGLVKSVAPGPDNPDDMDWIVNPNGTVLEAKTLIPAKKYLLVVEGTAGDGKKVRVDPSQIRITNQAALDAINVDFGVGPSDVPSGDFESAITLTLTYEDALINTNQIFYFTALIQSAPKALWVVGEADITSDKRLVENVLLGFDVATGEIEPDETPWADIALLGFKDYAYVPKLAWAAPQVVSGPAQPEDPFTQLEQTILSATSRAAILKSLVDGGTRVDQNVDVQHMAAEAADFLLSPPVFAYEYEPLR